MVKTQSGISRWDLRRIIPPTSLSYTNWSQRTFREWRRIMVLRLGSSSDQGVMVSDGARIFGAGLVQNWTPPVFMSPANWKSVWMGELLGWRRWNSSFKKEVRLIKFECHNCKDCQPLPKLEPTAFLSEQVCESHDYWWLSSTGAENSVDTCVKVGCLNRVKIERSMIYECSVVTLMVCGIDLYLILFIGYKSKE